jgi:hypothetical protein
MDTIRALEVLEDTKQEFLRELMQSVLEQSNYDGLIAYGGIAACERVSRRISARLGVVTDSSVELVRAGWMPRVRKAGD